MDTEEVSANEDGDLYTILLVEDCAADTVLTKCRVRDVWPNSKVVPVQSLKEAYETYAEHDFNLVLLDLNLPDGHGAETVKEMRAFNEKVPIVVLTGLGRDLTVSEALKLCANHVSLKSQLLDDDFKNVLEEHIKEVPES